MKRIKTMCAFMLAGILLLGSSLVVFAEEADSAGYHVYEVKEDYASDTWYATARGVYLKEGIAKLSEADIGVARCSGETLANVDCDVYVSIYLESSSNGTSGWGNVNYWSNSRSNAGNVSVGSGDYGVTTKKYYHVRGMHIANGGTPETITTCTNALYFDSK